MKGRISERNDQAGLEIQNGMMHVPVHRAFPEKCYQSWETVVPLVSIFSLNAKTSPATCPKLNAPGMVIPFILIQVSICTEKSHYFQFLRGTNTKDGDLKRGVGDSRLSLSVT